MTAAVLVAAGYLLGSIPSGVLLARLVGVDPRRGGSGNIGATNVARLAGRRLGAATLAADAAKGALAVGLARLAGAGPVVEAMAGLAAFVGHCFPVALAFRGGKGVATALGVLLVIAPAAAGVAVATFAAVLALDRRVSVASLAAAAAATTYVVLVGASRPVLGVASVMAAVIALRHRANLRRVVAGTEPRV